MNKQKADVYEKQALCNKTARRLLFLSIIIFMIMYATYSITNWISSKEEI